MAKVNLHLEVLTKEQKELLPKLSFLGKEGFYLAGGTALALQIGHRMSIDFDFYRQKGFLAAALLKKFQKNMKEISVEAEKKDTLILKFRDSGISLFKYDYSVLRPFIETKELLLLSLEDIAAMKVISLIQRGKKRDFVDIYFLLERFSLAQILSFTRDKYHHLYNEYSALRALAYFVDAENEKAEEKKRFKLLTNIDWDGIKRGIVKRISLFTQQEIL